MQLDQTLYPVDLAMKNISLEASVVANAAQTLKNFFPSVLARFREVKFIAEQDLSLKPVEIKYSKDQKKVIQALYDTPYTDLIRFPIQVPERLNVKIIESIPVYEAMVDHMHTTMTGTIKDFRIYIGSVLTNRDSKISLKDNKGLYKKIENDRLHLEARISKMYSDKNDRAIRSFDDMFSRNSEVEAFYKAAELFKKRVDSFDLNSLKDQTSLCVEILEDIIQQVDSGKIDTLSPEACVNLSAGVFEIAKEVEFFSLNYFRLMTFITASDELTNSLTKRLGV